MTTKKNITGSEALIHCLLAEGVDLIYGYPGGAIMPFYDELYKFQDKLQHVLTRHEQGATHAAQGYARVSGKVGVCVATSGPGATNLVTGIADAMIDSTPMVCLTGQVPSHLLGSDAFQETDIIGISTPVTKWNYQITDVAEIPEVMAKAFYIARSGRPGPVLVDITKDAQFASFDFDYTPCAGVRSYKPIPEINTTTIEDAAAIIEKAEKPLIVWGQGVILGKAEAEFKAFVEQSNIPAAWTILGVSAIATDHPLNVGMVGMHGNYGPNMLTNECDVLIAIGMRFDDRVTGDLERYAVNAKVIHIEIDAAEIDKNVKTDVAINADAKQALLALTDKIAKADHTDWIAEFKKLDEEEDKVVVQGELYPEEGPLKMAEVIRRISEKTKGKAVIVTDVGQHQMVASRYYQFDDTLSNVTSGGLGTMGFCLPAAMGAKVGRPDRQVIGVIGDGGSVLMASNIQCNTHS